MKFEYFDIHSHPYFPDYEEDRDEQIEEMKKLKIGTISIGTDFESSQKSIELTGKHDNVFASVGEHPGDLSSQSVFDERIAGLASNKRVVAIGECGLDYFGRRNLDGGNLSEKEKNIQKEIFEKHIDLSLQTQKPLMLHIRSSAKTFDAYFDALNILESHSKKQGEKLKGNAHFFAGNTDILKRFLNIGFTVSFTGVITFTHDYDEYIKYTPLDMIMSETDAPFVAPVPYRGKRNSSLYIREIVEAIASIREEDIEMVKLSMVQNALRYFKI